MLEPNSLVDITDLEQKEWDYDQSVEKMRKLVVRWKNLSLEIIQELYLARLKLSNQDRRSDLKSSQNQQLTWTQYLNDIGLARTTVHNWLSKYDVQKDEIISPEPVNLPQEVEIDDVLPTTHSCPDCGYEYDATPVESEFQELQGLETQHQFYPTHPSITQMLLDREELDGTVWEPACGRGDMSQVLISKGYDVLSTDLIDRGYGEGGVDFLQDDQISRFGKVDNIITNPPFKFALDFVLQSKKIARKKICILNATMFLDGIKRYEMWMDKEFPLKTMYQFSGRVAFRKNEIADQSQPPGGWVCWAWFVFEKGYTGKPTIDWILPDLDDKS